MNMFALHFLTSPIDGFWERPSLAAEPACHSFTTKIDAPQRWQTHAILLPMYGTMIDRLPETLEVRSKDYASLCPLSKRNLVA